MVARICTDLQSNSNNVVQVANKVLQECRQLCQDSTANLVHQVVDNVPGIVQHEVTHLQREVFELRLSQRRLNVVPFPAKGFEAEFKQLSN